MSATCTTRISSILLIAIFMEVSYGSKSCTCTFEDIPHYGYRSKQDKQLRTARDSENFHAGAAAHILFMESDTACDFRLLAASSDEMNYPLDGAGLLGQPRLSYHFIKYGSMIRKYGSTRTFVRKYSILYLRTKVRKYNYFRTSVLPWVPSYEGTKVLSYLRR